MSKNNGSTVVGILAGVAIGAAAGILFAPEKGSKTRSNIKGNLDNAKSKAKNKYAKTKRNLDESYEGVLSNLSHKADDVIGFLEGKLSDLKKQNAKLQK